MDVGRLLGLAIAAAALLGCVYVGIRTTIDPIWLVRWNNRTNFYPSKYPAEWRKYWWVRQQQMLWDPDHVRASPYLFWQYRIAGIVLTVMGALYLALIISWAV